MKNKIKTLRKDDTTESPAEGYLYTVNWSEDDEAYLVRVLSFHRSRRTAIRGSLR